jgi:hypothetical protein
VKLSARTGEAGTNWDGVKVTFNGSTTGYSERLLYGDGSTAASATHSTTSMRFNYANSNAATASTFGSNEFYVPNYAGSTNKSVSFDSVTENNATSAIQALTAGLWSNPAAITSIKMETNSGTNFSQHSTAVLYGISKS